MTPQLCTDASQTARLVPSARSRRVGSSWRVEVVQAGRAPPDVATAYRTLEGLPSPDGHAPRGAQWPSVGNSRDRPWGEGMTADGEILVSLTLDKAQGPSSSISFLSTEVCPQFNRC